MLASFMSSAERMMSLFILESIGVVLGLIGLVVSNGADLANMEYPMTAVKRILPIVRDGFSHGPDFDPGVDCSHDPDTGEELVSLTKQEFQEECDINVIMTRMAATGVDPYQDRKERGRFGDATGLVGFADAMNIVLEAEHLFSELPATIRDRFGNDPAILLEWLEDGKNRDEAISLGIVNPPPAEEKPTRVEVVNPSTPQPKGASAPSGEAGTAST